MFEELDFTADDGDIISPKFVSENENLQQDIIQLDLQIRQLLDRLFLLKLINLTI